LPETEQGIGEVVPRKAPSDSYAHCSTAVPSSILSWVSKWLRRQIIGAGEWDGTRPCRLPGTSAPTVFAHGPERAPSPAVKANAPVRRRRVGPGRSAILGPGLVVIAARIGDQHRLVEFVAAAPGNTSKKRGPENGWQRISRAGDARAQEGGAAEFQQMDGRFMLAPAGDAPRTICRVVTHS